MNIWFIYAHTKCFCCHYCLHLTGFPLDIWFVSGWSIHYSMVAYSFYPNFLKSTDNLSNVRNKISRRGWINKLCCSICKLSSYSGSDLSCVNLRVTLGWFIELLLVTGFLMSFISSTFAVAVAVKAIIEKSDFNLQRSLNALRKSLHSVNKCASLIEKFFTIWLQWVHLYLFIKLCWSHKHRWYSKFIHALS